MGRWVGGSSAEVFVIVKGCAAVDRFSGPAMQKCEWILSLTGFVGGFDLEGDFFSSASQVWLLAQPRD